LNKILKNKYLDIILYGSNVLNDFIPHRGDIDFIIVLEENLSDTNIDDIFNLHDIYRSKFYNNLEYQLEGIYYPKSILKNIDHEFIGCYIGTGRNGWKKITKFQNNCFDLIQLKNNGICYKNGIYEIYEPKENEIHKTIKDEVILLKKLLEENKIPLFYIIQYVARTIYYIETKSIGSKYESCKRFSVKNEYNVIIEKCGKIKLPDNYQDFEIMNPELNIIAKESLNELMKIIEKE